jgi:ferrochelatase
MKRGLLLVTLGSPEAPSRAAVARYLGEFLTDPYVIDWPAPFRQALVHGLIVPFRAKRSSEAYKKIWTDLGSPLIQTTKVFAEKLAREMQGEAEVRWAVRYGEPAVENALSGWAVDRLFVVPLYPQFAESSTQTAIDHVLKHATHIPQVEFLKDFFNEPELIEAQARQIQNARAEFEAEHILFSFHGLPEHHLTKLHGEVCFKTASCCDQVTAGNRFCYRAQAFTTARALRTYLGWADEACSVSFQSRLGRRPWIKPYTDLWIEELADKGIKRVLVACPSFVADCLETLEEIDLRLKEQFAKRGGELRLVPALNAEEHWVKNFANLLRRQTFFEKTRDALPNL